MSHIDHAFHSQKSQETLVPPISEDEELICHGHEVSSCEVHAVQKSNGVKALQSHALHLLDAFNCPFQRFRAHEIILRKILPVLTGQGHNTRNEKANKEPSQRTIWWQDSSFDFRCVLDGGDSLSTGSADDAGGWDAFVPSCFLLSLVSRLLEMMQAFRVFISNCIQHFVFCIRLACTSCHWPPSSYSLVGHQMAEIVNTRSSGAVRWGWHLSSNKFCLLAHATSSNFDLALILLYFSYMIKIFCSHTWELLWKAL